MSKRPNGPRNLKAGGFTNGLWRLEEREAAIKATARPHTYDYGFDIFTLHIIDYHLCLADIPLRPGFPIPHLHISPADWSRS